MRTKIFGLLLFLLPGLAVAQVTLVRPVPASAITTTQLRTPNGTSSHAFLRGHMILTAAELAAVPTGTTFTSFGMSYADGTDSPAGGTFRVYLQNTADTTNTKSTTWTTAIAPMTEIYSGTLQLPVGTTPATVDLALPVSSFVYTGGGLYVAYEYVGSTFAADPATYYANSTLPSSLFMNASTTALPTTVGTGSAFRPQLRFGYPNPHQNDLSVDALDVLYGDLHALWTDTVSVTIANRGSVDANTTSVVIGTTGANPGSETLPGGPLAGGASTTLTSTRNYLAEGAQTITASVAADEVPANDTLSIQQAVSCDALSYAGAKPAYDGIGFNTGAGILAMRYTTSSVPVSISAITVEIHTGTASMGKTIRARLLDGTGQIVESGDPYLIGAADLGTTLRLPLAMPVEVAATTRLFAGVEQTAGSPGYFPVSTVAPANIAPDFTYSFPSAGGAGTEYTTLGTLKIGFEATALIDLEVGDGGPINFDDPVSVTATPGYGTYAFLVNGNPVQSGPSNVLTYLADVPDDVTVTAARNACSVSASVIVGDPLFADGFEVTPKVIAASDAATTRTAHAGPVASRASAPVPSDE